MTKTVYIATDPDGGQHTRTTHRIYTHAVLVKRLHWADDSAYLTDLIEKMEGDSHRRDERLAEAKQQLAAATDIATWYAHTFCGRPDLALKAAARITPGRNQRSEAEQVYIATLTTKGSKTAATQADPQQQPDDPDSWGDEPEVTNDEENMGLIAAQVEPLPEVEVGTKIDHAATFLLSYTFPNLFEQNSVRQSEYRCKLCDMESIPANHREAHHTAHKADKSINAQEWAERRATMAAKTPKISKKTARDQGVPEIYLSESGNFLPGMDARYKSDLIASVVGIPNPKALMTFAPGDAHKRLEQRGWLGHLATTQKSVQAKLDKQALKASKAKNTAAKKATDKVDKTDEQVIAEVTGEAIAKLVSPEVTPDPKPVRKTRSDKGKRRDGKLTPAG